MMVMVRPTRTTGVYNWMAIRAGQLFAASRWRSPPARRHDRRLVGVSRQPAAVALRRAITFLLADALDIDPIPS